MNRMALIGLVTLAGLMAAAPGAGQEATAEVRTWTGQSWRLARPSFEVFYTIVPKAEEGAGASLPRLGAPAPFGERSPLSPGAQPSGLTQMTGPPADKEPEPKQGHAEREFLTLRQGESEIRVPVISIASLLFSRRPIPRSPLPPYVAPAHFRYSATLVLVDGSRVEGDYVNLGTTVLRGTTPQGRVEIPWEEIELVRFGR